MNFDTLENCTLPELVSAFNTAFEGYFIPISFTEETLAVKLKTEGIDLRLSAGVFADKKLVGFMLFAGDLYNGRLTTWNGGTGVLPEFRGRRLTQQMYEFIIPVHKALNYEYTLLEVIEHNAAARKTYANAGLQELRAVDLYKEQSAQRGRLDHAIRKCAAASLPFDEWNDWLPTWQHTQQSILRGEDVFKAMGYFQHDVLQGYCVYNYTNGRIIQLAVDPMFRRMGIAESLINAVSADTGKLLSVLNLDVNATAATELAAKLEFVNVLRQVEMGMKL
jgi:ribosomal protein S18 acetylase RimI-like enzyme